MSAVGTQRQELIDRLASEWNPRDIRDLASTLLRLADSLDQGWHPSNVRAMFRWPSPLSRIERNAANLAVKAQLIATHRRRRKEYVSADLLAEPAWDMLLDLFIQYAGGAKVSTTSLCIAASVPTSTALRYINALEDHGYVKRSPSSMDKRVIFVELTDEGILSVGNFLEQY